MEYFRAIWHDTRSHSRLLNYPKIAIAPTKDFVISKSMSRSDVDDGDRDRQPLNIY